MAALFDNPAHPKPDGKYTPLSEQYVDRSAKHGVDEKTFSFYEIAEVTIRV